MKEDKKECLLELIDAIDESSEAPEYLFQERVIAEAFLCIRSNLFRAFANKSKTLTYSEILENKKTSAVE